MRPTIARTARVVSCLALGGSVAFAQDSEKDDRAFGRLSPQRPVVEIPAEQQGGVDAANAQLPPPQDWEVRDSNYVIEPERPAPEPAPVAAKPEATPAADPVGNLLAEELGAAAARVAQGNTPAANPESQPTTQPADANPDSSAALASRGLGSPTNESESLAKGDDKSSLLGMGGLAQTGIALAIVVALILALAWIYERSTRARRGVSGSGGSRSPAGLIEVLARYPMGPRQSLVLLKFDRRVLLLNQTSPRGGPMVTTTLCELTDAEDVASVLVKVRDADGETINRAFRDAMERADRTTGAALAEPDPMSARFEVPVEPKPMARAAAPAFEIDYDPEDLRRTVGGSEADRNQLWEELGTDRGSRDPIGSLRRRLEAMRGGSGG
ncbi:MAG: flagellar biosynthetic protein FliO [Phycisphaerales bacterium]